MNTATSLVEMLHGVTSVLSFLSRLLFAARLIKRTHKSPISAHMPHACRDVLEGLPLIADLAGVTCILTPPG